MVLFTIPADVPESVCHIPGNYCLWQSSVHACVLCVHVCVHVCMCMRVLVELKLQTAEAE